MVSPDGMTVDEWHRISETYSRGETFAELLDGEPVVSAAGTPEHVECVNRLKGLFIEELGDKAVVSVQSLVTLDERSEPRPDLAVLSPGPDRYADRQPKAEDILLVVEVSDTRIALTYDRGRKAAYYARCGVPECWIVDLLADQVLLMRTPASGGYRDIRNIRRGASPLQMDLLPGIGFPVEEILGNNS